MLQLWTQRDELKYVRFIEKGQIKLSTYLITYRVGDIVDIKANAAQQRGMPHKYYHGCVMTEIISEINR